MAAFIPLLILAVVAGQDGESALIIAVTLPLIPLLDGVDRHHHPRTGSTGD